MSKVRLDLYVYENGYYDSREKSRIAIMEGKVYVNGVKEDKPGTMIKDDAEVVVKDNSMKYVSRGGYKLEKAIETFGIKLDDKICMDIGSSTGGFTDCMLKNNARKVFAVDCGTNQLDYRLRTNEKVITMENTNARYLTLDNIGTTVDFISVDVSFISLTKIIPIYREILKDKGESVLLIKPQFEAGKELVEKHGVVKDLKVHIDVCENIIDFVQKEGYKVLGLDYSPIKGPAGNIEYLLYIKKENDNDNDFDKSIIKKVVEESHEKLSSS